ncbi:MAG: copper transporter [Streptosporangiales bacterium]|nr:copper transporter [Streptosporangiales bacterium]
MIDFRYHVVSIVAVFLALAIGIVLGTTALREPVINRLTATTSQLGADNEKLRVDLRTLQQQSKGNDDFVAEITPQLVEHQLDGERVVVVEAPGADPAQRDAVTAVLKQSGATVAGRVSIQNKYLADGEINVIDELATRLRPPSVTLNGGTTYERAGQLLASAVVTDDDSAAESPPDDTVLSGFETAEYVSGRPDARATLAVMIAPSTPFTGNGAVDDNAALVAMAQALDAQGTGATLIGPAPSAAEGGLVKALRESGEASEEVSTVDAADTAAGRVVAVLALQRELSGRTGHFGTGQGVEGFHPTPYPTPDSPESTPSAASRQGRRP